jgi:hypothetical protein
VGNWTSTCLHVRVRMRVHAAVADRNYRCRRSACLGLRDRVIWLSWKGRGRNHPHAAYALLDTSRVGHSGHCGDEIRHLKGRPSARIVRLDSTESFNTTSCLLNFVADSFADNRSWTTCHSQQLLSLLAMLTLILYSST